jgi:hypothetical protein
MADVKKVMNRVFKINILFLIVAIIFPLKVFSLELGSQGPDGGIVFYVDDSGSHGLEAKAADEANRLNWNDAIAAASSYGSGWHLPTKDELNLLWAKKTVVGGFVDGVYWSSTEYNSLNAWPQSFFDGYRHIYSKLNPFKVRAVRAF